MGEKVKKSKGLYFFLPGAPPVIYLTRVFVKIPWEFVYFLAWGTTLWLEVAQNGIKSSENTPYATLARDPLSKNDAIRLIILVRRPESRASIKLLFQ